MNFGALDTLFKVTPWLLAGALALGLAWTRGDKIAAEAKRDEAFRTMTQLAEANRETNRAIDELKQGQRLNDNVAKELLNRLDEIDGQGDRINQRLRETLAHDPTSRDWGSMPVPERVRRDLRSEAAKADGNAN